MHALANEQHQEQIEYPNIFNELDDNPWFIVKDGHRRVSYRYDSIAEFFGENEDKYDGLGLCFDSDKQYQPGTSLNIGVPLPDSIQNFHAEVVSSNEKNEQYETGIWLQIHSEHDLLTLLRSCDYLNIRHTS